MINYLLLGLWTYLVLVGARSNTFKRPLVIKDYIALARGFLIAVLLWPLAPLICYYGDKD